MRINKFVAQATGFSRRAADAAIDAGRVLVNSQKPAIGYDVAEPDIVTLDGRAITPVVKTTTIMLNKPVGYVVTRNGQGNRTVYDLLPPELHHLKPVGRLDKESSGLLLLTNDGQLAYQLTHPKFQKEKVYQIELEKHLTDVDKDRVEAGVQLEDGLSKFKITHESDGRQFRVLLTEGRNRQIRRTFTALGYNVVKLHRTHLGQHILNNLSIGGYKIIN